MRWGLKAGRVLAGLVVIASAAAALVGDAPAAQVTVTVAQIVHIDYAYTDPRPLVGGPRCKVGWYVQFPQVAGATSAVATMDHTEYGQGLEYPTIGAAPWDSTTFSAGGEQVTLQAPEGTSLIPLDGFDTPGLTSCATTVAQTQGRWTLVSLRAEVQNRAPTAAFTWRASASDPLTIELDGASSTDDTGVSRWTWSFPDGTTATGSTTSKTFPDVGTYRVGLVVADAEGLTGSTSQDVIVARDPGTLEIVLEVRPAGDATAFSFGGSDPIGSFFLDANSVTTVPDRATFDELEPGRYTVTVDLPEGWTTGALTCNDPSGGSITRPADALVDADVASGETVTCRFRLDRLGDLVVNSVGDGPDELSGDGLCTTGGLVDRDGMQEAECTLRAAIQEANARVSSTIRFDVPGAQIPRIAPRSALPVVLATVEIDGASQPAGRRVIVDGSGTSGADGLDLRGRSSSVSGLSIVGFGGSAVRVSGDGSVVRSSLLGVLPDGRVVRNGTGVEVGAARGVVVGADAAPDDPEGRGNVILSTAVGVRARGAMDLVVSGNRIGDDETQTGIQLEGISGAVIGSEGVAGNVVRAGGFVGVFIDSASTTGLPVRVVGNVVEAPVGIGVSDAEGIVIGGRTTAPGVAPGNRITASAVGVDLAVRGATVAGNDIRGEGGDPYTGVRMLSSSDEIVVGGPTREWGNLVGGFNFGITTEHGTVTTARIAHNFVGLESDGRTPHPNHVGIYLRGGSGVVVESNVVSGNFQGLTVDDPLAEIRGNRIGTDPTGTIAVPNERGMAVSEALVVGGPSVSAGCEGACNLISGNTELGAQIARAEFTGNVVGLDVSGEHALPNGTGVTLAFGPGLVHGNEIAFNRGTGVLVWEGSGHRISSNRIHDNGLLGIDLSLAGRDIPDGVTPSDILDDDTGPNGLQNPPQITSVVRVPAAGDVVVSGVTSTAGTASYTVELFWSRRCDPSGSGEGAFPAGSTTTSALSGGSFTVQLRQILVQPTVLTVLTATVTGPEGTSEFSECVDVSAAPFLAAAAPAGTTRLDVSSSDGLVGRVVQIGAGATAETNLGVATGSLVLARPTRLAHAAGEPVVPLDDTLFLSVDRAVISRTRLLPDLALLSGRLRAIPGRALACGGTAVLRLGPIDLTARAVAAPLRGARRCVWLSAGPGLALTRLEADLDRGTFAAQVVRADLERLASPLDLRLSVAGLSGGERLAAGGRGAVLTYVR